MEKYTLTTLFELEFGDRFYHATDIKMKVFEVIDNGLDKGVSVKADDKIHSKIIRTDRAVVFLRNTNEENKKG